LNNWPQDDSKLLKTTCNRSVELNNPVASCQQADDNLAQAGNKQCKSFDKLLIGTALQVRLSCKSSIVALVNIGIPQLSSAPF
jgi:hypothetical protein